MLLLVVQYGHDGCDGRRVNVTERFNLMLQVLEHHTFDSDRRCGNRAGSKQAGDKPQHQSPKAAKTVTATSRSATTCQLGVKERSVPQLMGSKPKQIVNH